jgi:heme-degrading monooxygenase HmoA
VLFNPAVVLQLLVAPFQVQSPLIDLDSHVARLVGSCKLILEVAILDIKTGLATEFEAAFKVAAKIITVMPGYVGHELQHCLENRDRYILLVRWEKLEDHMISFRESPEYQEWRALLHHFYNPFPVVEHYEMVLKNCS